MEKHIAGLLRACRDGACTCGYLTSADQDVFVAKAIGAGDEVDPYPNPEQQQANMNRLAAAWNAVTELPTEALTPGFIKSLVEALTMARQHFPTDTGHLAVCGRCRECGEATPCSYIVLCRACAGKAIDAALAPFKGTQEVKP